MASLYKHRIAYGHYNAGDRDRQEMFNNTFCSKKARESYVRARSDSLKWRLLHCGPIRRQAFYRIEVRGEKKDIGAHLQDIEKKYRRTI